MGTSSKAVKKVHPEAGPGGGGPACGGKKGSSCVEGPGGVCAGNASKASPAGVVVEQTYSLLNSIVKNNDITAEEALR